MRNARSHPPIIDASAPETSGKVEQTSIRSDFVAHLGDDMGRDGGQNGGRYDCPVGMERYVGLGQGHGLGGGYDSAWTHGITERRGSVYALPDPWYSGSAAFRGPDRPASKRQYARRRRLNQPISSDCNHIHPGNGQSKVVLTLKPGTRTRQLLMGDYVHMPRMPLVMSKKNTIHVR